MSCQPSVIPKSYFPSYNLEKLAIETQPLTSEKKKKKKKPWLELINNSILPETLKFPVLSTVHALNRWATDKMITFMSQYG